MLKFYRWNQLTMRKYLNFLFRQGAHSIRRYLLILVGISISISMISGIGSYVSAVQNQYVQNRLYFIGDMAVYGRELEQRYVGDSYFSKIELADEYVEMRNFDFTNEFYYEYHTLPQLIIYQNYTEFPENQPAGSDDLEYTPFYYAGFEMGFYQNSRFQEFFEVVEGDIPHEENEFLIDYNTYRKLNLKLNEPLNVSSKFWYNRNPLIPGEAESTRRSPILDYNLTNFVVSGTYILKKEMIRFHFDRFESKLTEYIEQPLEDIPLVSDEIMPILGASLYNGSFQSTSHPVRKILTEIHSDLQSSKLLTFDVLIQFYGKMYLFDRDFIRPSHLRTLVRKISREFSYLDYQLEYYISDYEVFSVNHLGYLLEYVFEEFDSIRLQLYLFNIPIFFFAGIIGKNAFKTKVKGRKEEFLLFRSRGMNKFRINLIIIVEGLFGSLFITVLGTLGGYGFFYAFNETLSDFLALSGMGDIQATLNLDILWINVFSSLSLIFFSSIPVFYFVNQMKADKLLESLGSDDMDVVYNEQNLFSKGDKKKKSLFRRKSSISTQSTNELENLMKIENNIHPSSISPQEPPLDSIKNLYTTMASTATQTYPVMVQTQLPKTDEKPVNKNIYQNIVKDKETHITFLTYAYFALGILPLIPYFILILSVLPIAGDNLRFLGNLIRANSEFYEFFTILSAMFLPLGFIKLFLLNKPSRMAKIARLFSSIFLGSKSYICGLEIVRRKQFKNLIILLTIFSGMLCYANIYSITSTNQEIIESNLQIGADFRAQLLRGQDSINFSNSKNFDDFEDALRAASVNDESFYFQDIQPIYQESIPPNIANNTYQHFYIDFEAYHEMISESGKFEVNREFGKSFESIIANNLIAGDDVLPQVIVNSKFSRVFQKEVGDLFPLYHEYFNTTATVFSSETIQVKIAAIMDIIPGVYYSKYTESESFLVFDHQFLTNGDDILISKEFKTLFDVETLNGNYNSLNVISIITDVSQSFFEFSEIEEYDNSWNTFQFKMASFGVPRIYSIIHFQMILIGLLLAIGLSITILAFHEENKYFNGILIARGFGHQGLLQLIISEIFVLFIISFTSGLLFGLFFASTFLVSRRFMYPDLNLLKFTIFLSPLTLFGIISIIAIFTFLIFYISFRLNAKKSKTRYFHQF